MSIESIKFNNSDIGKALCKNETIWEQNKLLEPKLFWYLNDTSTYVEPVGYASGNLIIGLKNNYISKNSTGLFVYSYSTGDPFVDYFVFPTNSWLRYRVEPYRLNNLKFKYLHFSEMYDNYPILNVEKYAYRLNDLYYDSQKEEMKKTKMFYFEFDKPINGDEKIAIMDMIAENWDYYEKM